MIVVFLIFGLTFIKVNADYEIVEHPGKSSFDSFAGHWVFYYLYFPIWNLILTKIVGMYLLSGILFPY